MAGPEQGALVLGPPRSGKTSSIVIPNVLAARGPVVSTSTKPDVLAATLAARSRAGRCWLYDPSATVPVPEGVSVLRWSPVTSAWDWDGALLMARALVQAARPGRGLVDASHWTERAEALLAPLLHAAARQGEGTATLTTWVNRRTPESALTTLAGAGSSTAADLLTGIIATEERELSGIWSTASGVLAAYRSDAAMERSAEPNFDAGAFVEAPDTIYVCATGRHQSLVAPLVVGLLEDVRAAAYGRSAGAAMPGRVHGSLPSPGSMSGQRSLAEPPAPGSMSGQGSLAEPPAPGSMSGQGSLAEPPAEGSLAGPGSLAEPPASGARPGPPVLFALDEVANIAPLPALPEIVAEGGSQGLITLACLQDLSQGRARWGDAAEGFGSLFGATVVLGGIGDVRTLQALSARCGYVDVPVRSHGASGTLGRRSRSVTWSTRRQPRLGIDEVAQGRPGSALVVAGAQPPCWVWLTPWFACEPWKSLAGQDPLLGFGRPSGSSLAAAAVPVLEDQANVVRPRPGPAPAPAPAPQTSRQGPARPDPEKREIDEGAPAGWWLRRLRRAGAPGRAPGRGR